MRRLLVPVLLGAAASACTSTATVDLRSPGDWPPSCLQPNVICTAGAQGDGDGGSARDASFAVPESIAFDSTGNLFVADELDQRIRRIDAATGDVTTVVGDGSEGGGDGDPSMIGAPATLAHLSFPSNVTVCPDGWILFDQESGSVVWGVDPATDTLQVVSGDPNSGGAAADDVPADQARYAFGGDSSGLSCDARDVLVIADTNNYVVRALARGAVAVIVGGVTIQPGRVRTIAGVAGSGNAPGADGPDARASELAYPLFGLSLGDGRVLISDDGSRRLRLVGADGSIRSVVNAANVCCGSDGDGGLSTDAQMGYSPGVASDGTRVFVATSGEIRLLDLSTSASVSYGGVTVGPASIDRIAGALDGSTLADPWGDGGAAVGQAVDDNVSPPMLSPTGELWFAEPSTGIVRRIDAAGAMSVVAGYAGASGPADFLARPDDLDAIADGSLLLTAGDGHVWRLRPGATAFDAVAGDGSPTPGPDGVVSTAGGMVPSAIAPAPDGSLYVFDAQHRSLRVVDPRGRIETLAKNDYLGNEGDGGPLSDAFIGSANSALYADGILYWQEDICFLRAANLTTSPVKIGSVTIPAGGVDHIAGDCSNGYDSGDVPALQAHFDFGDLGSQMFVLDGKLWIDDGYAGRIRTLDLHTGVVHVVNDGSDDKEGTPLTHLYLRGSRGMALHDGWLYVTDDGWRIRRARLPDGPVETIAGVGYGESGDGATALLAQLEDAGDLAITPDGVVWVTERGHRLRRIQPGGLP